MNYIPIDDTAFLIPGKTWLKGYGRNSTDGLVSSITLHATIPDVQPWSKERDEEMYWKAGPGKRLDIYLEGEKTGQIERFYRIPQSIYSDAIMVEESSDQATQGLRKYRKYWPPFDDKVSETLAEFSKDVIELRRKNAGKPKTDEVFYELLEGNRMKYLINCTEHSPGLFEGCHLYFPVSLTVMAEVHFVSDHLKHVVSMADKLSAKLREFQASGMAYRTERSKQLNQLSPGKE